MDQAGSTSGNAEENVGIPDDLRCKRSDGKQWRCTAMSMPDKTVCEKHYIQAKRRAANSAMRASLKKAKRKSLDNYVDSRSEDCDIPLASMKFGEQHSVSGKKLKDKVSKNQFRQTPETPATRTSSMRNALKLDDDSPDDMPQNEENWMSYESPLASGMDSSRKRSQTCLDANATTEYSDGSTDSSDDTGGQTYHQCRRNDRDRVIWCLRCDRRGYCDNCILTWYSEMSLDEIQRNCPACRGTCSCKVCLRSNNSIKVRIREIPVLDKLQYLHLLLSSVLKNLEWSHGRFNKMWGKLYLFLQDALSKQGMFR